MAGLTRRRMMLLSARTATIASVAPFHAFELSAASTGSQRYSAAFTAIDRYAEAYMREMNSPGMTFVLANGDGALCTRAYGFSELERKVPVSTSHLFHIGSITKSFTAIALLQLRDEGKIDLHAPIAKYLPWLKIRSRLSPISAHHLLSHSSGLPGASVPALFTGDPSYEIPAAYEPGTHYYYSNLGFSILGQLIRAIDKRSVAESFRKRICEPLGMRESAAAINPAMRERTARSYVPLHADRPYRRHDMLAPAPDIYMTDAAGSIASTPGDMGRYIQMLINEGRVGEARVMSSRSFSDLTTGYVKISAAADAASYGYGMFIDKLDGNRLIRHTGGMVSFMSAMQIDLDARIGAFASINAGQGYRPNPVVAYAIRCMRAVNDGRALPAPPAADPATRIERAEEYAGVYQSPEHGTVEFVATGEQLHLATNGRRVPVERLGSGFSASVPGYDRFPFVFSRVGGDKGSYTEVANGEMWWIRRGSQAPSLDAGAANNLKVFTGTYRNESPWIGTIQVVLRRGTLWLDGVSAIEQTGDGRFRPIDPAHNPEWIEFTHVVDGSAMRMSISGDQLWRVEI